MAAAAKKKVFANFTTPVGVAKYPKLSVPHKWDEALERSVPHEDGELSTDLIVSKKNAAPLITLITETIEASGVKPKYLPYKDELDDEDEPTGNIQFKLKAYGKRKDGTKNKVIYFDTNGKPVKADVDLTFGSEVRFLGWISVSKMGCRLNIREAQIITLAEREGSGFDAYEGGSFVAEDVKQETGNSFGASQSQVADDDEIPF
jgi:hypothetical protein